MTKFFTTFALNMHNITTIRLNETSSTNDYFKGKSYPVDKDDIQIVVAESQSSGRGAGTNKWESESGKNLTFSILIHPLMIKPTKQFLISMAISNAISSTLVSVRQELKTLVSIKWPNDIYVDDRKICGILIENNIRGGKIQDCILGIGLNINQTEFLSDAPNPVSLKQISGHDFNRDSILNLILESFVSQLELLDKGDEKSVRDTYLSSLYRRSGFYKFRDEMGDFQAKINKVEDDGHIVLEDVNKRERRYGFKEVEFLFKNA